MSATATSPLQEASTSSKTHTKASGRETRTKAHSQQLKVPHLVLCILADSDLVGGLNPRPPPSIMNDELAPDLNSPSVFTATNLLSGPLEDFLPFIGQEQSKWLIDIAHDICDPALKRGSLKVWDEAEEIWRDVDPTDPPTPSIYLYDVWGVVVSLTKISERIGKSRSSATGDAATMASRVKQRDGQQCWVTRDDAPITNSHVCPKRMGDQLLRVVYRSFESTPPPPTLSIYDEICGITLTRNLDAWFDKYELGLRFVAPVQSPSSLIFHGESDS